MIITIQGKRDEGKTLLAEKICSNKKVHRLREHNLTCPFWAADLDDDVDFIIIDDVVNKTEVLHFFSDEYITINKRMKNTYKIKTPNIILVEFSFNAL